MDNFDKKAHWENIYTNKQLTEVSWYQPKPTTSLTFIEELAADKTAKIIDIGGGDSFLVDNLLDLGYTDLTVLDISEKALERAKNRLGAQASRVKWIVADAADFSPTQQYDLWHDRAAFHFLTNEKSIKNYIETARKSILPSGHLVLGTFSETGPKKCSGIEIKQYSSESMQARVAPYFQKIACINTEHPTPFNSIQNFTFCSFKPS